MEEDNETGLTKITDTIESVLTGIPAPLKKNFFKAFGQLCASAVDIPVAWLEGKASEIRATTDARVQIIKKEGEGFANEITVPKEYISKASFKYASKIIKEQINLDDITLNAAKELSNQAASEGAPSEKEIEDDWLNEFESHARLKSSDEMKLIFGKILSGEILNPGTFSIRTVRLISQIDSQTAKLFQILCNLSISLRFNGHIYDARVISFGGRAASNSLESYGLAFDNLNILNEYGLIISDYHSNMSYSSAIVNENNEVTASLFFNNRHYGLIPTNTIDYDKTLKMDGVSLTKAGKQLLDIIPIKENEAYRKELISFLEAKHLKMVELTPS